MPCANLNELPLPISDKSGWPWTEQSPQLPDIMPNGNPWPKISVVTPSLNQGQFIEETIRSVLLQSYPNLEYIIIDGGSTDGSIEIIKKYEAWITYWVTETDQGQSDAINKGWKNATGDVLSWINSDDTYNQHALQHVAKIFSENEFIVLLSGSGNITDVSGKTILSTKESPDINPYAMLKQSGGVPRQPSVFIRQRVLDEVGFLNTRLQYIMDWEFWIRIGLHYPQQHLKKTTHILSNNREWLETKTNKGWKYICPEHRQVFEDIFSRFKRDENLQCIKRTAYSNSYRKQLFLARRNGATFYAIYSLIRSWYKKPSLYRFSEELTFLRVLIINAVKQYAKTILRLSRK